MISRSLTVFVLVFFLCSVTGCLGVPEWCTPATIQGPTFTTDIVHYRWSVGGGHLMIPFKVSLQRKTKGQLRFYIENTKIARIDRAPELFSTQPQVSCGFALQHTPKTPCCPCVSCPRGAEIFKVDVPTEEMIVSDHDQVPLTILGVSAGRTRLIAFLGDTWLAVNIEVIDQ